MSKELYQNILEVVALIPYGKVATYGQVAKLAGLPRHARLVGYVLKHLDEQSNLPWHRVINSQGKISVTRLDTNGKNIQQDLMEAEGVYLLNDRVNLINFGWRP